MADEGKPKAGFASSSSIPFGLSAANSTHTPPEPVTLASSGVTHGILGGSDKSFSASIAPSTVLQTVLAQPAISPGGFDPSVFDWVAIDRLRPASPDPPTELTAVLNDPLASETPRKPAKRRPKIVPMRAFSDKEALTWLIQKRRIETSAAALGRDWRWDSKKVKTHLDRWSSAGHIEVKPGLRGRAIISAVSGQSPTPSIPDEDATGRRKAKIIARLGKAPLPKAPPKRQTVIKIRSRSQVIQYSRILIAALEEVVDYDPQRHHNQPPPELRIDDDDDYLREIRNLIAELRTLNSLLEATRRQPKQTSSAVVKLTHHVDTFLSNYAKSLAKGAGWLTIGVIASLLYQAGIGQDMIANILSHAKFQR